ncbi:MAG: ABC transporter substrate-binding protein, partial [Firmicutes bacterium]|nr:ABC transporter substrate-binding protein [Bacillota bacterium]
MKKFLAVLLILVMVFTFAACGGGSSSGGDEGSGAVTVEDEVKQAEIRQAIGLLFDRNYICEEIGQAGQL